MTGKRGTAEMDGMDEMVGLVDWRTDSLMGLIKKGFPQGKLGDESWKAKRIIEHGGLCEVCDSKPASHTVDFDVPGACEHVLVCGERDCVREVVRHVAEDLKRERGLVDWNTFSVDGRGRG